MGTIAKLRLVADNLKNAFTGQGTRRDATTASRYVARPPLTQDELAAAYQSGLMRKIVQIPPLDMVREWRERKGEAKDATEIEGEETRLEIRQKVRMAEVQRRLGGGALILGLPGLPASPAPETIGKGELKFVHVVSRWQLGFHQLQLNALLPGYGEPVMWKMPQAAGYSMDIHPSRVIPFRADTSSSLLSRVVDFAETFWGESVIAQCLDAVMQSETAQASFAALLHKARLTRMGIPGLMDMVASGQESTIQDRMEVLRMAESIHNMLAYDAGDEEGKGGEKIDDTSYNFQGAKDMLMAYAEFVCAISDIPATRLLGRAPEGLNSSGDGQQEDWRKQIRAKQTLELDPCMARLDRYLVQSALGKPIDSAWYDWSALGTPTEKERADVFKTESEAVKNYLDSGLIPDQPMARGVQSMLIERGYLPELELALSELPEEVRWGLKPTLEDVEAEKEAANAAREALIDPQAQPPAGGNGNDNGKPPAKVAANDARPRSLYVSRQLLNAQEFIAWAKSQGFGETLEADDFHVTIAYSRTPLDWMKVESAWNQEDDGSLIVPPGGVRLVEELDGGAVALLFGSSPLSYRHESIVRAGGSHDYPDYQPHVTITYAKPAGLDLKAVEPFRGKLRFGPEIFEEIDETR